MKIDLTQIDAEPRDFTVELVLVPERVDADRVASQLTVRLEGEVRPVGASTYSVSGRWTAEGPLRCVRCLEPVPWRVEEQFEIEYRLAPDAPLVDDLVLEDEDLDVVFLEDGELDLEELAAEQALLALPMRIVCDTDCAGLCPRCGANRNIDGACRCQPEVDPRWAALADFGGGRTS